MGAESEEANLKGISKYFNSVTLTGRANVAKATYAAVGGLILYMCLKPSSKKSSSPAPVSSPSSTPSTNNAPKC